MWIDKIEIKNYKLFENITVDFDRRINIVIGNNGSGKSSLLSAVLVGASSFLSGIAWATTKVISPAEVRHKVRNDGGLNNRVDCYPAVIKCSGVVNGHQCEWERRLNGPKSRTTNGGIKEIRDYSRQMEQAVIDGEEVILPLIAYYGTGRLWAQKKKQERRNPETAVKVQRI